MDSPRLVSCQRADLNLENQVDAMLPLGSSPQRERPDGRGKGQLPIFFCWFQVACTDHEHGRGKESLKYFNPPHLKCLKASSITDPSG
jgi:hypothetical protein